MKLAGRARIWIAAGALAASGCGGDLYYKDGKYSYGCYLGPLSGSTVLVDWSQKGERADTTINGRAYAFRLTSEGLISDIYKDGEAGEEGRHPVHPPDAQRGACGRA